MPHVCKGRRVDSGKLRHIQVSDRHTQFRPCAFQVSKSEVLTPALTIWSSASRLCDLDGSFPETIVLTIRTSQKGTPNVYAKLAGTWEQHFLKSCQSRVDCLKDAVELPAIASHLLRLRGRNSGKSFLGHQPYARIRRLKICVRERSGSQTEFTAKQQNPLYVKCTCLSVRHNASSQHFLKEL